MDMRWLAIAAGLAVSGCQPTTTMSQSVVINQPQPQQSPPLPALSIRTPNIDVMGAYDRGANQALARSLARRQDKMANEIFMSCMYANGY